MNKSFIILALTILLVIVFLFFSKISRRAVTETGPKVLSASEKVPVIIVPHFDAFADKRAELLTEIGKKVNPKTIVVVSVNHFNAGSANIITADRVWELSGGNVAADSGLVEKLISSGLAVDDKNAFIHEHGITNVLADVRGNLSDTILPIIIKDTASRDDIDQLYGWMTNNLEDYLVVASVDFSHYQPNAIAQVHDAYSIQALSNLDLDKIWSAETDSPQTLYLAAKISENLSAKNFHLHYNSNSGELNDDDDSETTSVVLGYFSDQEITEEEKIEPSTSFLVAGDAMFDRAVWHYYKGKGIETVFDNFGDRVFCGTDLSLLNLEGPISATAIDDDYRSDSLIFNFPPQAIDALEYLNINAVSLANNHSNNAGTSGLENTRKVLDDAGIKYFGKPYGYDESSVLRIDGPVPLTVIGVMALEGLNNEALRAQIVSEKNAGRKVLVFPHWGVEYATTHSYGQESFAKSWIEAGADLVFGSHPHVVEDFEIIDGKPVIYSLGNFVFDQFFSQETQEGLAVAGTITKDKITLTFLPTKEKLVKPELMSGEEKTTKIRSIFDIDSEIGFKKLSSDTIEIDI